MIRHVTVPKWGLTIPSVRLLEWHRQVGEAVAEGDPLCTVETDKASAEIEAPWSGTIVELRAAVADECDVGTVIAVIESA